MRLLSVLLLLALSVAAPSAFAHTCRPALFAVAEAVTAIPSAPAEGMATQSEAAATNAAAPNAATSTANPDGTAKAAAEPEDAAMTDWRTRDLLPADIAAKTAPPCSGAYVQPQLAAGRADGQVDADASNAEYHIGGAIDLSGDVAFVYKDSHIRAEHATFDSETRQVHILGDVVYRRPGLLIKGRRATLVLQPQTASVERASFVLHDGGTRGRAKRIEQLEDGSLLITDGRLTRCDPGDEAWTLATGSVTVDPERKFATAINAVLRIEDVPVAYVPYLRFPVNDQRASGFLFPTIGRSRTSGVDVSVPYYLNLAPNYDATITPRYLSDRGTLVETEGRYRSEGSENVLGFAYLPRDHNYNGSVNRDEFSQLGIAGKFKPVDRWLFTFNHKGDFGPFETAIDYAQVSDLDYFVDLGTDLSVASKSELARRGSVAYVNDGFRASLSALRVQPLQFKLVEPYERLPSLTMNYEGRLARLPLNYRVDTEWSRFDRNADNLLGIDQFTGSRFHVEPRLTIPLRRAYGHLDTTVAYRYTRYHLQANDSTLEEDPHRSVGLASVDGGLTFERATSLLGTATTQTLEPRLYYLWSQRERQDKLPLFDSAPLTFDYAQLFRENRFSGRDRIADANQLTLAVTTRYLDVETGVERARASVGRILKFAERKVDGGVGTDTRSHSPWAGEFAAELAPGFGVRGSWVWDSGAGSQDAGRIELHYQPPKRFEGDERIIHVGYSRGGNNIRQTDVSAFWPVTTNLSLIGRWYYDIDNGHTLESFAGVQLDGCCFQVRVLARRYLRNSVNSLSSQPERGIFFQFVLKGLAGFGGGVDRILENGIPGYDEKNAYELH